MKNQLSYEGLREDLICNENLRTQSEELISALVANLSGEDLVDLEGGSWNLVVEILGGIAIARARQGFSTRETGRFVHTLKEALLVGLIVVVIFNFKLKFGIDVFAGRLIAFNDARWIS